MAMLVVHVAKRVRCNRGAKVGGRATACLTLEKLGRARCAETTWGGLSNEEMLMCAS